MLTNIDETIVLCITAECPNLKERKRIQKRYRLRGKIRQAIAEGMGTEDYGTIQVDSQSLDIDRNNISCQVTLSVHHFSKDIEINMQSNEKRYSSTVTKLIESCNDGTLASVKCTRVLQIYIHGYVILC